MLHSLFSFLWVVTLLSLLTVFVFAFHLCFPLCFLSSLGIFSFFCVLWVALNSSLSCCICCNMFRFVWFCCCGFHFGLFVENTHPKQQRRATKEKQLNFNSAASAVKFAMKVAQLPLRLHLHTHLRLLKRYLKRVRARWQP